MNGENRVPEGDPAPQTPTKKPGTTLPRSFAGFPGLTADQATVLHNWLADSYSVSADRLAYVAIVEIADAKYRRRPYLTLAAAQAAVERAEARGVRAKVGLFEIVPLGGAE